MRNISESPFKKKPNPKKLDSRGEEYNHRKFN